MTTASLLFVLLVVQCIAIYPLSRPLYRPEDLERIQEGQANVKSMSRFLPGVAWFTAAVLLLGVLGAHDDPKNMAVLLGLCNLFVFVFLAVAFFCRSTYYIWDEKQLAFIKHGQMAWSHLWDEIDRARRRIISTGKSVAVVYDIYTKDGIVHCLPSSLARDLKGHLYIDNSMPRYVYFKIIIAILFIVLLGGVAFLLRTLYPLH